ncbi:MAG: hypothetical protein SFV54_09580 [Bryobacteraceae bacterium]|nr:hypothetical protein [Bryobacteraceae bacterium]
MGYNDGIKRGDRADTGDLEAQPTQAADEGGSGTGNAPGSYTVDSSSMGAESAIPTGGVGLRGDLPEMLGEGSGIDDLTILDATDPALGLTNIGDVPADDWAADTGPTHTAEAENAPVATALDDTGSSLDPNEPDDENLV